MKLIPTLENHSDMIDAYAYAFAVQEAETRNCYILLYIKAKPWWLPKILWHWLLDKILVLSEFKSKYYPPLKPKE